MAKKSVLIRFELKNYLRIVAITLITVLVFWFLFRKIDFRGVLGILSSADVFYLLLAFILTLVFPLLVALRWKLLVSGLDYDLDFWKSLSMIFGTFPINAITPSKAGDVIKVFFLRKHIIKSKVLGAVICERLFDLAFLVLLCFFGVFTLDSVFILVLAAFVFVASLVAFLALSINWRFKSDFFSRLKDFQACFKEIRKDASLVLFISLITLVVWILAVVQSFVFFLALGVQIPFTTVLTGMPIAIFIGLIPITLGGMGTRDAAIIYMFSDFASSAQLLGVGLLFSFFRYWILSLFGLPFLHRHMQRK
ncbi:TPA: flippase-like domain-containing protein [Candidatus Woesearchaeota archaeon]|nr:flippase-like domain-containing protein [Candidatus Woesearchaeota archaeon]